jgi:DNA-directed RNA polymerase specialized sigma24 family protein
VTMPREEIDQLAVAAKLEPEARERLFAELDGWLRYMARRFAPVLGEDGCSEAAIAALEAVYRYDPALGSFRGFAYGAVWTRLDGATKRERRHLSRYESTEDVDGESAAEFERVRHDVEALLRKAHLSEVEARAMAAHLSGATKRSASETLGVPAQTYLDALHRAVEKLATLAEKDQSACR